jgi:hypothetical protein
MRQQLLDQVEQARTSARQLHLQLLLADLVDDPSDPMSGSPSPNSSVSDVSSLASSSSQSNTSSSTTGSELIDRLFNHWDQHLQATAEEIQLTRVLQHLPPVPRAPQIQLLDDHRVHRPHLFRKAVRVNPSTFDKLVGLIEDHPVFHNNSNYPQLAPATQLAIFLNRAGHYGNRAGPDDLADWVGKSTGTIENCTNRVMVAILDHHDKVFGPPTEEDVEEAKAYVEYATECPEWRDGILTGDGTMFPLYQRPGLHGDAWFDRKSNYSINAQVGA